MVSERPYGVRALGGNIYWVQEFSLIYSLSHNVVMDEVKDEFEDAFARIWFGEAESEPTRGLPGSSCSVLYALTRPPLITGELQPPLLPPGNASNFHSGMTP